MNFFSKLGLTPLQPWDKISDHGGTNRRYLRPLRQTSGCWSSCPLLFATLEGQVDTGVAN